MLLPEPAPGPLGTPLADVSAPTFAYTPCSGCPAPSRAFITINIPPMAALASSLFWMIAVFYFDVAARAWPRLRGLGCSACGRVYLSGLGGRLLNLDDLKRWQRPIVLLAGPLTSLLLVGALWMLCCEPVLNALKARSWAELFVDGGASSW